MIVGKHRYRNTMKQPKEHKTHKIVTCPTAATTADVVCHFKSKQPNHSARDSWACWAFSGLVCLVADLADPAPPGMGYGVWEGGRLDRGT